MNKLLVERSANSDSMKSDLINLLGISRAGRRAAAPRLADSARRTEHFRGSGFHQTKSQRSATAGSQASFRVSGRLPVSPTRPGNRRHHGTGTVTHWQAASGWSGTQWQADSVPGQQRRARSPAGLPVRYHGDTGRRYLPPSLAQALRALRPLWRHSLSRPDFGEPGRSRRMGQK